MSSNTVRQASQRPVEVVIPTGFGINCEVETAFAFKQAGANALQIHLNDLIEHPDQLAKAQILALAGGFSFGDHLGYHSLKHPFPFLKVEKVFHRKNAVWPFTVVGRPPQEDSMFGKFVHKLTGNILPTQVKGVREVHAVDAKPDAADRPVFDGSG